MGIGAHFKKTSDGVGAAQSPSAAEQSNLPSSPHGSTRDQQVAHRVDKHELLVNHLFRQQNSRLWISNGFGELEGVLLLKSRGHYVACPPQLNQSALATACAALDLQCVLTINNEVIRMFFLSVSPDAVDVELRKGIPIQILPRMEDLARAQKRQYAAFISSQGILVVWDDDISHILDRATGIESALIDLAWKRGEASEESE